MSVLVGVCSVKGSPGATLMGLGLASVWPGSGSLFVEADPSGGDVSVWYGTGEDPGLVSLAAAARRAGRGHPIDVLDHACDLGGQLYAVPGPMGADQARAAVTLLASRPGLLTATAAAGFDVVVADLGRLDPGSVVEPLLPELDVLLVVSRTGVHDLSHLAGRGPVLADRRGRGGGPALVGVLLTGPCRYRISDIEEAAGLPVLARVPFDDDGAAELLGGTPGSRWGRLGARRAAPLVAALRELAERLDAAAPPRVSPAPDRHSARTPTWAIAGPAPALDPADPDAAGPGVLDGPGAGVPDGDDTSDPAAAAAPQSAAQAGWTRPVARPVTQPTARPTARPTPGADTATRMDAGNPWVPSTSERTR